MNQPATSSTSHPMARQRFGASPTTPIVLPEAVAEDLALTMAFLRLTDLNAVVAEAVAEWSAKNRTVHDFDLHRPE